MLTHNPDFRPPVDLSIVLPVRDERDNLVPLLDELESVLKSHQYRFEVIVIDDGSTDGSTQLLETLTRERAYLRVLRFRRNCGQSAAFDAGFRRAAGNVVITMDADLQNDPADIPKMLRLLDEGFDVVVGNRANRADDFLIRTVPSRIANFVIRRATGTRIRDLGCSLKIYRRQITDELRLYGEMHRFVAVLAEGLGARTAEVVVNHRRRRSGQSKYGLMRTFKVLLDLLTVWFMRGYSTKPIYVFGGLGILMFFGAILLSAYVLFQKLAEGIWVHRNPLFTLSMIMTIVGVQFMGLGLLAEITIRTYFESQQKPSYLIGAEMGFDRSADTPAAEPTAIVSEG